MTFNGAFSQRNSILKPGDIDDCWVVAGIQGASNVGGIYHGVGYVTLEHNDIPTIPSFRHQAGKPDVQGVSNAGGTADIERGINGCYPNLVTYRTNTWTTVVAKMKAGMSAVLVVDSSKLPTRFQFGFTGGHAVTLWMAWNSVKGWVIMGVNPLMAEGAGAMVLTEAEVRPAFLGACMVGPAPVVVPPPVVVPAPPPVPAITQADVDTAFKDGYTAGYNDALNVALTTLQTVSRK